MLLYFVVLWIKKTFYSLPKLYFSNEFLTPGGVGLYNDENISFSIQDDLNLLCNKCENV